MRTIIIGEVSNNWESEKDILESIKFLRSRNCLIKFQAFGHGQFKHLEKYVLPGSIIKKIASDDVFYSVFDKKMVDSLESLVNPKYYKIASRSYEDKELIKKVITTGKRVFMSIPFNREKYAQDISYLHCVSAYPAMCANLQALNDFDGYSDHTTSTIVPALAVAKGAKIIEKHFKIREMDTPDSPHSLLPKEWDEMLKNIKDAEYHCGI